MNFLTYLVMIALVMIARLFSIVFTNHTVTKKSLLGTISYLIFYVYIIHSFTDNFFLENFVNDMYILFFYDNC